ncbi:MAG TPA: DUF2189 domain-containing protein [Rhizomicrobium sp.]|jgi:uncharacterized membrane protein|nr:DUF2189 domain-containing protein [Rhizomicrobium sp.]
MTIRNPIEWTGAQLAQAAHIVSVAGSSLHHVQDTIHSPMPVVRRIGTADLRDALAKGFADFEAYRTDVLFLGIVYAAVGLVLTRIVFGMDLLPLLFPLASGFAIIGPFAAVGLYEMSRLREQGRDVRWSNAFDVFKAPAIGAISVLGAALIALFLLWLAAAWAIYLYTFGPEPIVSLGQFAHDVLATPGGQSMMIVGVGVGFLFALFAMSISIVSFPLLLDRDVGLDTAIRTSIRAMTANPGPMALWGLLVAAGLVIGSLPLFVGLIVILPVLGHATWHLYRKILPRDGEGRRPLPAFDDVH